MNDLISAVNTSYCDIVSVDRDVLLVVQHTAHLTFGSTTSVSTAFDLHNEKLMIKAPYNTIDLSNNVYSKSSA